MRKIKIGIIGCGYWGPNLARNFHEIPEAELTWVCDIREERLKHLHTLYPYINITRDYQELLSSDVDAIVISTPVYSHFSLSMDALRAKKHILVEKPLAATSSQAEIIAETAEKNGLIAMTGHTFLYNPAVTAVRNLVKNGDLGQIYYINTVRVNLGLLQPDINVVWDLAPHEISILLYILDNDPTDVKADGETYIRCGQQIHEVAYLTMHFPENITVNSRFSWLDPVKVRKITIVGSRKMLVYDDIVENKVILYDKGVEVPPYSDTLEEFHMSYRHGGETNIAYEWCEPLRAECVSFLEAINLGYLSMNDARFGIKVVKVLEAAQKSIMKDGERELINYERTLC